MTTLIAFVGGLLIGGLVGMLLMAVLVISGLHSDMERNARALEPSVTT